MKRTRVQRLARTAGVVFFDGFRAAPGWMALVTALLVLGSIASTCYPLGYRALVDGALADSPSRLAEGVAIVGGLLSLGWLLSAIGATEAMTLSDRISLYRTAELVKLTSGIGGLEHLERPDFLNQVERINNSRRQLAAAPRVILRNVSTAARIIAFLVLLGSVSPWLLLLPLSAVPPMVADRVARKIGKRADDDMADTRRKATLLFGLCSEPQAAPEIRSYGLAETLTAEHTRLVAELNRRSKRQAVAVLGVQSVGWLVYAAALMAAIAFVVIRATDGAFSLGTVLMSVSLIRRSRTQLASAASGSGALLSTLTTTERLLWLEDYASEQRDRAGTEPPPVRIGQGIRLDRVSFSYPGKDEPVLAELNLTLPAGATVALVGENGSGKTTLIKLLLGLYEPTSGQILIDNVPLSQLDPALWRERCTAAFQDFARFQLPAVESIGVADLPELTDEPAAIGALHRAGAGELVDQLPQGIATRVGTAYTGGHGLSGGQWQKIALARAMRRDDPLLVLLDEPTASLDPQAEHALFERYTAAASESDAITVLVSHRFSTVLMADLIVYLEDGQAAEVGSHTELMARQGRYAELFELQAAGYR